MIKTRLNLIFDISCPIILQSINWVSGPQLAAAVSEAGGLGVLNSDNIDPESFRQKVQITKEMTSKNIAVGVSLKNDKVDEIFQVVQEEGVKVIVTTQGSPELFTRSLKERGFRVVHEATSVNEARKSEEAGVDAVIARGIESSGVNGKSRLGTAVLTPLMADSVKIPVIACGGIVDGRTLTAALSLGAEGVQMGTRFASTWESDAHKNYKEALIKCNDSETVLINRKGMPVRLINNDFAKHIVQMEDEGANSEEILKELSFEKFAQGMKDGDIQQGALIAGQGVGLVKSIKSARDVIREMLYEILVISDQLAKYKPAQSFA